MVDGVTKLMTISEMARLPEDSRDPKVESLRKMLLAMVDDVRVVLIKLADRLHNMRTMAPCRRSSNAASPARRWRSTPRWPIVLGIWQIKWELEDLSFRYLEPDNYAQMKQRDQPAAGRSRELHRGDHPGAANRAERSTASRPSITGPAQTHLQHLAQDGAQRRRPSSRSTTVTGVRVIVPEIAAIATRRWAWCTRCGGPSRRVRRLHRQPQGQPVPVAAHGRRSGRAGKPLEVQIRTPDMHRIADVGIAAHWRYKAQTRQRRCSMSRRSPGCAR